MNDTTQATVPAKPKRIKRDFKDINTKISQWASLSADATVTKVTQEINGGTNGLQARKDAYAKSKTIFK